MHKKILVIAPRDCLKSFDESVCESNVDELIGGNSGNSIFWFSIQKLLLAEGVESHVISLPQCANDVDRINNEYSVAVMCPANALNYDFRDNLSFMAETFSRFKIPIVVIGLGAQSSYNYDMSFLDAIGDRVKLFVRAVLNTGGAIECRGQFTGEVLERCGFRSNSDYEVIGCPSVLIYGQNLKITKDKAIGEAIVPAFNGPEIIDRRNFSRLLQKYPLSMFISQDKAFPLLFGTEGGETAIASLMGTSLPVYADLAKNGRLKMFFDLQPWSDALKEAGVNFGVGTRIHGNIVGILSGIPAYIWAKDSRVREMAEFFCLPHEKLPSRFSLTPDLDKLYCKADYSEFNKMLPQHFVCFKKFMNTHGLPWGEDFSYIDSVVRAKLFRAPAEIELERRRSIICAAKNALNDRNGQRMWLKIQKTLYRTMSVFILNRQKRKEFRRRHFSKGVNSNEQAH